MAIQHAEHGNTSKHHRHDVAETPSDLYSKNPELTGVASGVDPRNRARGCRVPEGQTGADWGGHGVVPGRRGKVDRTTWIFF